MGAALLVARRSLQRQWTLALLLVLVTGLTGGVVLTAVAGARRTDSAYERLLDELAVSTLSVEAPAQYHDDISALPQVETSASLVYFFLARTEADIGTAITLAGVDESFTSIIDRPILLDGRFPDPARVDEVFLNTVAADAWGVGVGSDLSVVSLTPAQVQQMIFEGVSSAPEGPTVTLRVVGVGRTEVELASPDAIMALTPAFTAAHRHDIGNYDSLLSIRLRNGDRDVVDFERDVQRIVPVEEGVVFETATDNADQVESATHVQAVGLVVVAAAVALTGLVTVALGLARATWADARRNAALVSLGMGRRTVTATLILPLIPVAVGSAVLAGVIATGASRFMPVGFARQVEPDPGFDLDIVVLGSGMALVALAILAPAVLLSVRAIRRLHATSHVPVVPGASRSRLTSVASPLGSGVSMALRSRSGGGAAPARSGLAGAVAGIAGLVGALAFAAALTRVVEAPSVYGETWDAGYYVPGERTDLLEVTDRLAGSSDAEAVAALSAVPLRIDGDPLEAFLIEADHPDRFVTVLEGRLPIGPGEILVGSATLDAADLRIGDVVVVEPLEADVSRELTIVGRGVFPDVGHPSLLDSDIGDYNEFALLTADDDTLVTSTSNEYFGLVLVDWASGDGQATGEAALAQVGAERRAPTTPSALANFARVRHYPAAVAAFVAAIAVLAAAYALATSTRQRSRDLAVLRALGYTPTQVRATISWQSVTIAAVGLAAGVPLGILIGRTTWRIVADDLGIAPALPTPWAAIVVTIPVAFALARLLAVSPGRRAVRRPPAEALRAE